MFKSEYLNAVFNKTKNNSLHEPEYLQVVYEMFHSIDEIIEKYPNYIKSNLIERLVEPERIIQFRVAWMNQKGEIEVNKGYRVQHSSALGVYKGGIRFHPSVNLSIMKFLAFEQTFKNALTTLPMGGGKGGADFNPKGRSDEDIMRFCQAYISELYHYIGNDFDIPAGDIGVSQKEVGYMYGYYKKLSQEFNSSFTGKHPVYGGSFGRKEATGFGLIYFTEELLATIFKTDFNGKNVVVSGSGNVGSYAAIKVKEKGAKILAMSDASGFVYNLNGINPEWVKQVKEIEKLDISHYLKYDKEATFNKDPKGMWKVKCDIAFPCATQNELDEESCQELINNSVMLVAEGANMPTTKEGVELLRKHHVIFAPGKAANAGGVTVSGLEISQNHQFIQYPVSKVDEILCEIMRKIFHDIHQTSILYNKPNDLLFGANIYSFLKVAQATFEQGIT